MERLNFYPRGYLVRLDNAITPLSMSQVQVNTVPSDPAIETLYKLYMTHSVNSETWPFRRRVIQRCSQLFGNFEQWLRLQITSNDSIYGLNLEFLRDTVQFIRTGHRDMSVFNWHELVLEYPEEHHGVASPRRLDGFQLRTPGEFNNFIGDWCSHPGGFDDMLCTAHVLFGVAKRPLVTHPL